jgi:hypothetical protein
MRFSASIRAFRQTRALNDGDLLQFLDTGSFARRGNGIAAFLSFFLCRPDSDPPALPPILTIDDGLSS